jgi:hypothetical protein
MGAKEIGFTKSGQLEDAQILNRLVVAQWRGKLVNQSHVRLRGGRVVLNVVKYVVTVTVVGKCQEICLLYLSIARTCQLFALA